MPYKMITEICLPMCYNSTASGKIVMLGLSTFAEASMMQSMDSMMMDGRF